MATLRKLQTEIDKTLKKVQEGMQIFDDFWDQVRLNTTPDADHNQRIFSVKTKANPMVP